MPEEWDAPFPFGFASAADATGSVAAPLLAGFSFALVGLVLPAPEHFRWPSLVLTLFLGAGVCFITAVQCSFWARQYAITPQDIEAWRPNYPLERKIALQRLHSQGFRIWVRRLNRWYKIAILLLLAGLVLALVPPGEVGAGRLLALVVAGIGFVGELGWVLASWVLTGSPGSAFDAQPDAPREGEEALWLRRYPPLRRLARFFQPLVRVDSQPPKRQP